MPTRTIIQRTSPQHILQDLIDSLGLPICLSMERCTELQPSAQGLIQLTPKLRSKLSTSIRHNLAWNSMQTHDHGHINLGYLGTVVSCLHEDEVSNLHQTINHYPDGIIS